MSKKGGIMGGSDDLPEDKDDKGIQVVSRALSVLRALGANPGGLSLAEIAAETDLPRSSVQRLIGALEIEGFVEPMGPGGGSRLGPAILQLMLATHGDILSVARPLMQAMSDALKETVVLSGATGRQAVTIDRIVATRELCVMLPIGNIQDSWTTSIGKALLATLPDDLVLTLLAQDQGAPKALASAKGKSAFLRELEEVRKTKIAYDRQGAYSDICSIAVATETYSGAYAVAIVTPVSRFETNLPKMREEILKFKQSLESLIGEKKRRVLAPGRARYAD